MQSGIVAKSAEISYVGKAAEILQLLAQLGMQIFVTTHDYLLSHELSLRAEYPARQLAPLKFFALYRPDEAAAVQVETGDTMADLQHNLMLDEFSAHHDREVELFQEEGRDLTP